MQSQQNKQKSLLQLQQESEEQFRKQFDPSSQSFHNGSTQPVPIGGSRVPDLMYSMYPQGYDPNKVEETIDYGQQYRKIQEQRKIYQDLKKSLAKLCPAVQGFLRHSQIFKQKGQPDNQNHLKIYEENMKKQEANLKASQQELEPYVDKLKQGNGQALIMSKQLVQILQESNKKYTNKQQLANFNFKVKKLSTQAFSSAQKHLQKLKDIKKQYKKKHQQSNQEKTEKNAQETSKNNQNLKQQQ